MKATRVLGTVIFFLGLTALGLVVGWFARSQTLATPAAPTPPLAGAPSPGVNLEAFSPRALQNMGVSFAPAAKSDFVVHREVLAVVEELPSSLRPITARWGGIVEAVLPSPAFSGAGPEPVPGAVAGRLAGPGEVILEILRAPIPRLERALTGEFVQMANETVHEAAMQLRAARRSLELSTLEYERIRGLNRDAPAELPVIPRQTEINLRYDMLKAKAEVERLEGRLFLHGLAPEQVENLGAGLAPNAGNWRLALERNGLWPPEGGRILASLPEALRTHPLTFVGLGELAALGKCGETLAAAVAGQPALARHFHEAAALLQQGYSLDDVLDMARSGALESRILVRAPAGVPVWEIREIRVRPGEKVEAGGVLALLADNRRMALAIEAPGVDAALVENAMREGTALEARPLAAGVGPVLRGLHLAAYSHGPAGEEKEPRAYAVAENELIRPPAGQGAPPTGAWRLRKGMRYRLLIPAQTHREVFVFPREAVVAEGAERVLFLRSGSGFRRQPVRILHEDRESVVLAGDGAVFPGDPAVISGAFALSLALRAESQPQAQAAHKHGATCQH